MKPYTDLMIDLETFGTSSDSVVIQIGWCFFDRGNKDRTMFTRSWWPSTVEQVDMGRRIDMDTLAWWQEQPTFGEQLRANRRPLQEVVDEMMQVWSSAAKIETLVWAKGTPFDIGIWRTFLPEPWMFRNIHDLRTALLFNPDVHRPHNDNPHDAVADAVSQAQMVQEMYREVL